MPSKKRTADRGYLPDQKVRLLFGGKPYFDLLLDLINHAVKSIHLQVYIFEGDGTGQRVADALVVAANRGVSVHVLVDGYGSQALSRPFIAQFRENGIHFRVFEPLLKSKRFYIGRRMHQKVVVVDAWYAVITGANIGDKYNDRPGQSAWLDFALFVEGETAAALCAWCWTTWKNFRRVRRLPTACKPSAQPVDFGHDAVCPVRMRRNDWVRRKYDISRSYKEILRNAKHQVVLVSSYFLPGPTIRRDIDSAVKRGVRVQVLVCNRMDVPLVKDAERYMYNWLLEHKVEIYEYIGNMLHGKLAVCDDEWLTIGSFNVNDLSARVSVELNLDVQGTPFVRPVVDKLRELMDSHCVRIRNADFEAGNNLPTRFKRWVAFKMLRVIFFLGTFYIKQEQPAAH